MLLSTVGDEAAAWLVASGVPLIAGAVLGVVLVSACFVLLVRFALSAVSAGD